MADTVVSETETVVAVAETTASAAKTAASAAKMTVSYPSLVREVSNSTTISTSSGLPKTGNREFPETKRLVHDY